MRRLCYPDTSLIMALAFGGEKVASTKKKMITTTHQVLGWGMIKFGVQSRICKEEEEGKEEEEEEEKEEEEGEEEEPCTM